jgi:hypothetical protein
VILFFVFGDVKNKNVQFNEAPEFIILIGEAIGSYFLYLGMHKILLNLQFSEAHEYTIII